MATLSELGIPNPGMGILHPNVRHRFTVRFLDGDQLLPFSNALSAQVMSTPGIAQFKDKSGDITSFTLQDDMTNQAFKALLELQKQDTFNVAIDILDGNETILRTTLLKGCQLESFHHGDLDYASSTQDYPLQLEAHFPSHVGEAIGIMGENPIAAAILTALSSSQVRITGGNGRYVSAANELHAYISYGAVEYEFYQKSSG